jgi:hypothetical protein
MLKHTHGCVNTTLNSYLIRHVDFDQWLGRLGSYVNRVTTFVGQ